MTAARPGTNGVSRSTTGQDAAQPTRQPPHFADVDDVQRVADDWSTDFLQCRDVGHHWVPEDAVHVIAARFYRVIHACTRCEVRRTRELSERGHVFAQTYDYPDGYMIKGLGRIAGEAKDALRLASTLRGTVHDVRRKKLTDDDLPRFAATRRGTEGDD